MPNLLKRTKTKLFPDGIYKAVLKEVEVGQSKFDQEKQSATLTFQTEYKEYPGEAGRRIKRSYTFSLYEKSKLSSVVEALLGRKIAEEEELDLDVLIGKECRLKIENKTGEVSGKLSSRVEDVLPVNATAQF